MEERSRAEKLFAEVIQNYFESREGPGAIEEIGSSDLIDAGWLDSLDLVEIATIVSEFSGNPVDLTDSHHFEAMRTIQGIINFSVDR